jgi:hypothetical protein
MIVAVNAEVAQAIDIHPAAGRRFDAGGRRIGAWQAPAFERQTN